MDAKEFLKQVKWKGQMPYSCVENDIIKAMKAYASQQMPSEEYEIDFAGHVKAKIIISNNDLQVEAAMNGYGDGIRLSEIKINKLKSLQQEKLHKIECSECGGLFMSPNPNETLCRGCEVGLKKRR